LLDWKEIWAEILERNQITDDVENNNFARFLRTFPEDFKLEDTDFYKSYLSKFVLDEELCAKGFYNDCDLTFEECYFFLRLVAAAFSSKYDITYLPESDKLELSIHVDNKDETVTRKLQDLFLFQIVIASRIYLEEGFKFEHEKTQSELAKEMIDEDREKRLIIFEKKMQACLDAIHGLTIKDKLDELLNS